MTLRYIYIFQRFAYFRHEYKGKANEHTELFKFCVVAACILYFWLLEQLEQLEQLLQAVQISLQMCRWIKSHFHQNRLKANFPQNAKVLLSENVKTLLEFSYCIETISNK